METPQFRSDVAVFVDFENVYVSVREKFDATPNFELIMDRCEDYGRIVLARAYADWYRYPRVTSALFANGVEPMYVPTYYYDREVGRTGRPIKNSVDIHLCIDVMRTLYTQTHIQKFVLVTGDRDFIPLVNAIRQSGKEVIVIGIGGAASAHLAQSADEFLFYEQIADLKTPQQRQEQRSERRERPAERDRQAERERAESNGRYERRDQPVERPAPERSVYDTLVDAIKLARQRGFVCNLGSLKVLMRELDSTFKESKVRDASGRPFSKFKDFVQEAERLGKVQVFTNGTVTEVFLPGEDPYSLSQFAEDLASQRAERELETELDLPLPEPAPRLESVVELEEAEAQPTPPSETDAETVVPALIEQATEPAATPAAGEQPEAESVSETEGPRTDFGEREWEIALGVMAQFTDPMRFMEIFSTLRGLRNQELLDLSNAELKDLVKQAINRGILQRTGRGAKAYYRLSSPYRNLLAQRQAGQPVEPASATTPGAIDGQADVVADDSTGLDVPGIIDEAGPAEQPTKTGRRRRRRSKEGVVHHRTAPEQASDSPVATPTEPAEAVAANAEATANGEDVQVEQAAAETPRSAAVSSRQRRRRKKATATANAAAPHTTSALENEPAIEAVQDRTEPDALSPGEVSPVQAAQPPQAEASVSGHAEEPVQQAVEEQQPVTMPDQAVVDQPTGEVQSGQLSDQPSGEAPVDTLEAQAGAPATEQMSLAQAEETQTQQPASKKRRTRRKTSTARSRVASSPSNDSENNTEAQPDPNQSDEDDRR